MRFEKPFITVREFSTELGVCYMTGLRIIASGKVKHRRTKTKYSGRIVIDREWADEFHKTHTFGGQAYGK
jgi:hypothetical protein